MSSYRKPNIDAQLNPLLNPQTYELFIGSFPDFGFVTDSSATTLRDASKRWPTNLWTNYLVVILSGAGAGQTAIITSNTATVLTTTTSWAVNPAVGDVYKIYPLLAFESAAQPNLKVAGFYAGTEWVIAAITGDGNGNQNGIFVNNFPLLWNGSNWDRPRTPNIFKPQNAVAVATEATVWTPAAGKKFRLMGGVLTGPGAAGAYEFRDNTAGTIIFTVFLSAGQAVPFDLGNGILSGAADRVLTCDGPASATLTGTIWGTEE